MSSSQNKPIKATTPMHPAHVAVEPLCSAPIIHESGRSLQEPDWQLILRESFTDLYDLLDFLQLDKSNLPVKDPIPQQFGLRVPRGFASQIEKGNANDPLLLQVLPTAMEAREQPGFGVDPVGDLEARAVPGILHKYHGRALIISTGACAIHCRYCFRRYHPYANGTASPRQWQGILDYLQTDPSISEVILSGGDPLMVQDERLTEWLSQLNSIPHLKRLRLHTRLPVVVPERITSRLLTLLDQSPLQPVVVLHVNHPNELSRPVVHAVNRLKTTKATLLNQSVLLRGVNDAVETLTTLSERLFAAGILPYYLHMLDRVAGSGHFEVEEPHAQSLYQTMLSRLPGYLVPKLVREIAGRDAKTPLSIDRSK